MELDYTNVHVKELTVDLSSLFKPLAKEKGIDFVIDIAEKVPDSIETDRMRLEQILKNLISNAVKFTSKGAVSLIIRKNAKDARILDIVVKDTGIGIAPEKQNLIFEAFQQADGSTKRKYGGTGLGLSISRELVKLLGGEIELESNLNIGSEFTVFLPIRKPTEPYQPQESVSSSNHVEIEEPKQSNKYISTTIPENIPDDRNNISSDDKTILIVEDDTLFAKSLLEYTRQKGYKGIVAVRGDEGLQLAREYIPTGILLDLQLPILSGWDVMDRLKKSPLTRHIPVHVMSSYKMKTESLLKGAVDFIDKPMALDRLTDIFKKIEYVVSRKSKKVLIVEDNPKHAQALASFLETFNINSDLKNNIAEGITALQENEVDCVILDMGIPDQKAYETLEEVKKNPDFEHHPDHYIHRKKSFN